MQKSTRRKFIATAATAATAAAAPAALAFNGLPNQPPMLVHHVFFWLKNPGNQADRDTLLRGLQTLAAIEQVQQLLTGTAAPTENRGVVVSNYDVSELMYFKSLEDQATYQAHPLHQAFIEKHSHLWAKVVVYDTWMGLVEKG